MPIPAIEADPCGRAAALKAARDRLVAGEGTQEVEIESGNGVRKRARYARADMDRLDGLIAEAAAACARSLGLRARPRRRAMGVRFTPY